jgi:hypothetical protein
MAALLKMPPRLAWDKSTRKVVSKLAEGSFRGVGETRRRGAVIAKAEAVRRNQSARPRVASLHARLSSQPAQVGPLIGVSVALGSYLVKAATDTSRLGRVRAEGS